MAAMVITDSEQVITNAQKRYFNTSFHLVHDGRVALAPKKRATIQAITTPKRTAASSSIGPISCITSSAISVSIIDDYNADDL